MLSGALLERIWLISDCNLISVLCQPIICLHGSVATWTCSVVDQDKGASLNFVACDLNYQ